MKLKAKIFEFAIYFANLITRETRWFPPHHWMEGWISRPTSSGDDAIFDPHSAMGKRMLPRALEHARLEWPELVAARAAARAPAPVAAPAAVAAPFDRGRQRAHRGPTSSLAGGEIDQISTADAAA